MLFRSERIARQFVEEQNDGRVFAFYGQMGAGKTTFIAAVCKALGIEEPAVALVITVVYYLIRRVVPFAELMECIPEGFKSMVSPILVLSMAWTLKGMTDSLGLARFVANMMDKVPGGFVVIIPALFFVVSCALGFASGTSWGTFGILIPIALAVTSNRPDMSYVLYAKY